jgi:hypothetical protein
MDDKRFWSEDICSLQPKGIKKPPAKKAAKYAKTLRRQSVLQKKDG